MEKYSCFIPFVIVLSVLMLVYVLSRKSKSKRIQSETTQRIQKQAENPLDGCWLCTACGWFGRGHNRANHSANNSSSGCLTVLGIMLGCGLVLIGLPLLLVFGIGVIPIIAGIFIIITTIGASAVTSSQDRVNNSIQTTTPNNCPSCKNHTIIPAGSPKGQELISLDANFRQEATLEIARINELTKNYIDCKKI